MRESRKKEIRIKAASIRDKFQVSRYAINDLFKECERLGYKLLRYPLGEDADLGFTTKKDNDIVIFTNTSSRYARELFTLAHEIGHAVLHLDNSISFIDNVITVSGRSNDDREQEANYFAACLLMPDDEIIKFLDLEIENECHDLCAFDIARIMSEFNVSFETVLNRLENIKKISTDERLRIDNERNQIRIGKLLRSIGGNSKLNEAANEIYIPFEYIYYIIFNYNNNAIPKDTLLRALDYCNLTYDDISDKLIEQPEDDDDLDTLIGGLED